MESSKPSWPLPSHDSTSARYGTGQDGEHESIQMDDQIRPATLSQQGSKYPEFAHLRIAKTTTLRRYAKIDDGEIGSPQQSRTTSPTPTTSFGRRYGEIGSPQQSRTASPTLTTSFGRRYAKIDDGEIGSSRQSRTTSPTPTTSFGPVFTKTLIGSPKNGSLRNVEEKKNLLDIPRASNSIDGAVAVPQAYASAEPFLSTPVNAMIRNCYKRQSILRVFPPPERKITAPDPTGTPPTPGIPLRSYKRLMRKGSEVGEALSTWTSRGSRGSRGSSRPQHFEQHFEMSEWINMLKEKADITVESMQKPPPPPSEESPSSSSPSECEKAVKPYRCPYLVMRLAPEDEFDHMSAWKRILHASTPLTSLLAIGIYWCYFVLRIIYTVSAQRAVNSIFVLSWVFIYLEIGVTLPAMFHQFWQSFILRARERPKLRLISDFVPSADIFITCYQEENEVILDTVRATLAVSWPISRFRVIVLDDGASPSLRAEIEKLSKPFPNLHYSARIKVPGVPHHGKAGNLNHGLKFVEGLKGGAGEFCAALDADMIPEPDWLRTVVAHVVVDAETALACPPQLFYNVPKNDPIAQNLNSFVHDIENIKDTAGVAWCTGSGYAVRRAALDDIGGFPTGSLAEDVSTSSMLLDAGWKTAYVHEPLQWGTVPDSFAGHVKQRTRWSIGSIQTCMKLNFFLYGPLVRQMTFLQRLCGFIYSFSSFSTIWVTLSLLIMPIGVASGFRIVAFADYEQLRWLIRAYFLALLLNRINDLTMSIPASYRLGQRNSNAMLWMAPYYATTIIRAFLLPECLGGKTATFASSGRIHSSPEERNQQRRAPLLIRLKVILWNYGAGIHLIYIILSIAAIAASITRAAILPHNDQIASGSNAHSQAIRTLVYLLTHTFWPPLLMWIICIFACLAPISYAIWTPDVPVREELLKIDGQGVSRPTEEAKRGVLGKWSWFNEGLYSFLTVYTAVVFVGSWFY